MFGTLLFKEIRSHLQTFRFSAALVTTFILIIASAWILGEDYDARQSTYNRLSDQHALNSLVIYVPSRISPVLLRPPTPLSIFAQGEDSRLGNMVQVRRWQVPSEAEDGHTNSLLLGALPPFDLLTIFILVMSLFGILLTYDAFSGEKERGTLKMICLCNVSRGTIFTVKFLAALIVLSIPFLISILSALIILQFIHGVTFNADQWFSLGAMGLTGLLYGAFFITAGLLGSVLAQRSSLSLVLSLMIWVIGVLLIPAAAQSVATMFKPLPDPEEINQFAQITRQEALEEQAKLRAKYSNQPRRVWGYWSIGREAPWVFDADPVTFRNTAGYTRELEPLWRERADRIWNLVQKHSARKSEQMNLASALSFLSPAHHLSVAGKSLGGTDYASFEAFMKSVQRFRRALLNEFDARDYFGNNVIQFFSRRTWDEVRTMEQFEQRIREYERREAAGVSGMDLVDFRSQEPMQEQLIPPFEYGGAQADIDAATGPILFLAGYVIIGFIAGFVMFLRYDVR